MLLDTILIIIVYRTRVDAPDALVLRAVDVHLVGAAAALGNLELFGNVSYFVFKT